MICADLRLVIPAQAGIQKQPGFRVPLRGPGMTAFLPQKYVIFDIEDDE